MKNKNLFITLGVLAVLVIVVVVVIRSLKNRATDLIANTPVGSLAGVRTVEAQGAFARLMKMKFLEHTWITKANLKYNTSAYQMPLHFTTQQATDIARELKDSRSLISTDWTNDNDRAIAALFSIQNQVQAAQVADAYYNTGNHKNLNRGLAWLSNEAMVTAANHLGSLPTGVYQNGVQLTQLTV